ncbi:MAG: 5-amino-6-(D-ribitylamino)uracil--L-tyrosine 4-hydroxyphenyl transferase CofH [Rhizobiaceae bacterium]|nr:5-amino-6-(D-ribitylamino)uracil--L-tyrosine 4-hydroxyphenyl transferase CofH [Rhizobiaceae bacterium]
MTPQALLGLARDMRERGHSRTVSFSPKVFIPLTQLCRDVCGYCTFAHPPRRGERAFMAVDKVLEIARAGAAAGCTEALFTLGELPEQRYRVARGELTAMGHETTIDYLVDVAGRVATETGLLPHINAGIMSGEDMERLRAVSVSQGLMLESTSLKLLERGGPHFGSKGKHPQVRIDMIAEAGRRAIPFTTGILAGIGETRADRVESLLVIKALHERFGHIQEVIVQNFQPKPGTRMAGQPALPMEEMLWTVAAARIVLGPDMNIQAPPNLSFDDFPRLLEAGINDWGGVSPVTPDHVNPEAAWPTLEKLRIATERSGAALVARLPIYPAWLADQDRWLAPAMRTPALRASDAEGWGRADPWSPGTLAAPKRPAPSIRRGPSAGIEKAVARSASGARLGESEIAALFAARAGDFDAVVTAADALRRKVSGGKVRYVVNRNINYTNVCAYKCSFCAFSKGKASDNLRGKPYEVSLDEVSRRAAEAWERGATEVCMQGGIHPAFTGQTYLDLLAAAKRGAPSIHVHAFSPLEVAHGAETLAISVERFLGMLRDAGLGSLPGTAAEILDDDARAILCPDKLSAAEWLGVVEAAHRAGLPTTSTIMFGHIDTPLQWARHLLSLRDLQERTGGITEFVPLPFVHMEAPLYFKGGARKGPTFREAMLMHAVSRLVLNPLIANIQVSWVKLGAEGVLACLDAGANDLGGTLMNESISRAAGTQHGQELPPIAMDALIARARRDGGQRTTLYSTPGPAQVAASYGAADLAPLVLGPVRTKQRAAQVALA